MASLQSALGHGAVPAAGRQELVEPSWRVRPWKGCGRLLGAPREEPEHSGHPELVEGRPGSMVRQAHHVKEGDALKQRIIVSATNAHLHDAAQFLASLPPEKITAIVRASSSWREVLRRKGFGDLERQLAASDQKPTGLQLLLLVSAALADSENDLATVAAQISGTTGVPVNGAAQAIPSFSVPAAARPVPVLQNLLR